MKRANDNLPSDIREALAYLADGGLSELSTMADGIYHIGRDELQCSPSMMLALCILAAEALGQREQVDPAKRAEHRTAGNADKRRVAIKLMALNDYEQRRVIIGLDLDAPGDGGLNDYQFALAALRRAEEREQLDALEAAILAHTAKGADTL